MLNPEMLKTADEPALVHISQNFEHQTGVRKGGTDIVISDLRLVVVAAAVLLCVWRRRELLEEEDGMGVGSLVPLYALQASALTPTPGGAPQRRKCSSGGAAWAII